MRARLTLDIETIMAINEELARRLDIDPEASLEKLHGSFTVQIIKGRFQVVEVASSRLLNDQQRRQRNIA